VDLFDSDLSRSAPEPGSDPVDLGDPGPADDASQRASYLYEHVIDALVVFSSRYIRTAFLLTRRPSFAADRLLSDLELERGRYTRPMGFLAISYLLFVVLYANLPWVSALIESGGVGARPDADATQRLTVPMLQLLSGFGNVETDYLMVAILAPLPAVVLVSLLSTTLANVLGAGGDHPRARFSALVQYAVGLGMLGLTWFMVQSVSLIGVLVKLDGAAGHRPDVGWLAGAAVAFLVWSGVMTVASGGLFLGMSVLPVWRALKMLPDLARLGLLRRGLMSLSGPAVLGVTLFGLRGLVHLTELTRPYDVGLHVAGQVVGRSAVTLQAAVQNQTADALAVVGWRALWRSGDDHETTCRDLSSDGNTATAPEPNVPQPRLVALGALPLKEGDARIIDGVLYLEPGQAAWLQLIAPRPLGLIPLLSPSASTVPLLCVRTSVHPSRWVPLAD